MNITGQLVEKSIKKYLGIISSNTHQDSIRKIDGIWKGESVQIKHSPRDFIKLQLLRHYNTTQRVNEQTDLSHYNCGDTLKCQANSYLFYFIKRAELLQVSSDIVKYWIDKSLIQLNNAGGLLPLIWKKIRLDRFDIYKPWIYLQCAYDERNEQYNLLLNIHYSFLVKYASQLIKYVF
jgi:hypothetical protein